MQCGTSFLRIAFCKCNVEQVFSELNFVNAMWNKLCDDLRGQSDRHVGTIFCNIPLSKSVSHSNCQNNSIISLLSVSQAAFLLQVPKHDSTAISSHCYKLNSLQLRQLLELYEPDRDEQEIPIELIDNAVAVAENTADSLARGEGQEVRLEEEPDLHLPFLLPEDGYSSELIRGVPPGLREFLEPLIKPGKYLPCRNPPFYWKYIYIYIHSLFYSLSKVFVV